MKAIVKTEAARGGTLLDLPQPTPGPRDALVRVDAATICGTDIHIYEWDAWSAKRIKPPRIYGHEIAGTVVEVGRDARGVKVGDKVSVETHIPCGVCFTCRTGNQHLCENLSIFGVDVDGGFAQYAVVPDVCCWVNDPDIPAEFAAMQEPLGNACYTVSEAGVAGKRVVVLGDGPIGIFATAIARAFGATQLIAVGMKPYRMNLMRAQGPDHVLSGDDPHLVETIRDLTDGGPEVVLEMSGSPYAIRDGLRMIRRCGTFAFFGIPSHPVEIDVAEGVVFKGIKMLGINGRKMFETWYQVAGLLKGRRIDVRSVLTHRFPLSGLHEAMDLLSPTNPRAGKIALYPHGVPPEGG